MDGGNENGNPAHYLFAQMSRSLGRASVLIERIRISGLKARMSFLYNLRILNSSAALIHPVFSLMYLV